MISYYFASTRLKKPVRDAILISGSVINRNPEWTSVQDRESECL